MISVITPTNNTKFLKQVADSLRAQTFKDFEWIVLMNGKPKPVSPSIREGLRCKYLDSKACPEGGNIGALKREACGLSGGEIIVELDHDDMLTPDALAEVAKAFDDPEVGFVYSNCAEFREGTWKPRVFGKQFGWVTRPFKWKTHTLVEMVAFPPTAHSFANILFAPNHVRAWRKSEYDRIGRHDPAIKVGDDHDLMCRFYLGSEVRHIDKCLYLYRLHDKNSCYTAELNPEIRKQVIADQNKYLTDMVIRWATSNGYVLLDLCSGPEPPEPFLGIDLRGCAHLSFDLSKTPWPVAERSVGVIRAFDALEHLPNPVETMMEVYRVLLPGGWLLSQTPSTTGPQGEAGSGAFQDPTHVSFWNENSFWYWTQKSKAAFIGHSARFQAVRLFTTYLGEWNKQHHIPHVRADLVALKGDYRAPGEKFI